MKGVCEIAFPSISASMLRTFRFMRRMDHAAPSDVRGEGKRMAIQQAHLNASTAIIRYAPSSPFPSRLHVCKCGIKYTKRGKSRGSCHIKNRAPVADLMSPRHHALLSPHISSIMFVNFPPVALLVLAASSPMPARVGRTTGGRSQFRLSQTENMEIRRRTVGPLRAHPPPPPRFCKLPQFD